MACANKLAYCGAHLLKPPTNAELLCSLDPRDYCYAQPTPQQIEQQLAALRGQQLGGGYQPSSAAAPPAPRGLPAPAHDFGRLPLAGEGPGRGGGPRGENVPLRSSI